MIREESQIRSLSLSLVNCDTISLIFVHDSICLRSSAREREDVRFTRRGFFRLPIANARAEKARQQPSRLRVGYNW